MYYFLICRSLTHAQRTLKRIERAGVTGYITKAPQALLEEGCGYSVRVTEPKFQRAMAAVRGTEFMPRKIILQHADGHFTEVQP